MCTYEIGLTKMNYFIQRNLLSTSIYDLVLLNVCHFHQQHFQGFWKFIEILVLTSWILHPRIFVE